jgi:Glycosyltransferase Family 4
LARITYLSFDGASDLLGHSQVVRPLRALKKRGFEITLATLEKSAPGDVGFAHLHAPFATGSRFFVNVLRLARLALKAGPTDILHARSVQAGVAALLVQKTLGAKVLFDTRAYWAAQRHAQGLLPGLRYGVALGLERAVYRRASAIVMLTELAAREVREGKMGVLRGPVTCIPTLADENDFMLKRPQVSQRPEVLRSPLVLGFVGSVNADYLVDASLLIWKKLYEASPEARFLAMTPHESALRDRMRALDVKSDGVVFKHVPHDEAPRWLRLIDWGLLLLRDDESKHASMPTKLGEFFLSGVRPVHYGCNSEVAEWVTRTGTGFSLKDVGPRSFDRAVARIRGGRFAPLEEGRARALPHFSLGAGVDRYAALYSRAQTWSQLAP